jgi:hypothetical protein
MEVLISSIPWVLLGQGLSTMKTLSKTQVRSGLRYTPGLDKTLKALKKNFKRRQKPPRTYKWYET